MNTGAEHLIMEERLPQELARGIQQLGLSISRISQDQALAFLQLLQKWNRVYNLTATADLSTMLVSHLLDSLSIAPWIKANHIVDVGSGAGFPGIPLALAFPEKQFVLIDSVGKKVAFLRQVIATIKILNVTVEQVRAEQYQPASCFEIVVCRALGTIAEIIDKTHHLLCDHGQWLFMKGEYPQDELANVHLPYKVERLPVPGLNAERHLIMISKETSHG